MKLFDRDYEKTITDKEKTEVNKYKPTDENYFYRELKRLQKDKELLFFMKHYTSLFPNNLIYPNEMVKIDFNNESEKLKVELDKAKKETDIQKYIKNNKKWFIPASIRYCYSFGNHQFYLFKEFRLADKYITDYAILGKSSIGYSLVLIEFEDCSHPFLTSEGLTTKAVNKGIKQINDWRSWMSTHFPTFLNDFDPQEKGITFPLTEVHYCLVVSRRKYFEGVFKKANEVRSQIYYDSKIKIITYDRLVDNILKFAQEIGK